MKKLFFILLIIASFSSSCDDFLNTEPIDKVSIKQYYDSEEGLTQALAGVYDPLGSEALYGNKIYTNLFACTDEGYYARSVGTTATIGTQVYNFDSTDSDINSFWEQLYVGINRSNELIANINLPKMDENKREIILGEALFLRGYYHFLLVSNFGDIPLKLKPTTTPNDVEAPRNSTKEVYNQILKDMTDAETKVTTSTLIGYSSRVSKTTVQGILARVCLQMAGYPLNDISKYPEALAWSKKVQVSGEHALNTTFNATLNTTTPLFKNNAYSQIFINESQDIYDIKENMWEVDFKGNRTDSYTEGGRLGNTNGITMTNVGATPTIGYSYGFIRGTARLYKIYNAKDLRRDWVLTNYTYNSNGITVANTNTTGYGRDCAKWRRSFETLLPKHKNYTPTNFPILRYSDVLLMIGESENQVNGPTSIAYEAINQVRRRGFGLPTTIVSPLADLPVGLSKEAFQQAVEDERMRELCFEGTRRSDLIRWGKFVSTMNSIGAEITTNGGTANAYGGLGGTNVTDRHLLYPIPSLEIASNRILKQNPGW